MFSNYGSEKLREKFAEQFEPDGNGYLYRRYSKDAPIHVSATERETFIATFNRRMNLAGWGVIVSTVALIALLVSVSIESGADAPGYALYTGLGATFVGFLIAHRWMWNHPARELRERPCAGPPRSRAELRQGALARLTYGEIAVPLGSIALIALVRLNIRGDHSSISDALWLTLGISAAVFLVIGAWRKWRFDSTKK